MFSTLGTLLSPRPTPGRPVGKDVQQRMTQPDQPVVKDVQQSVAVPGRKNTTNGPSQKGNASNAQAQKVTLKGLGAMMPRPGNAPSSAGNMRSPRGAGFRSPRDVDSSQIRSGLAQTSSWSNSAGYPDSCAAQSQRRRRASATACSDSNTVSVTEGYDLWTSVDPKKCGTQKYASIKMPMSARGPRESRDGFEIFFGIGTESDTTDAGPEPACAAKAQAQPSMPSVLPNSGDTKAAAQPAAPFVSSNLDASVSAVKQLIAQQDVPKQAATQQWLREVMELEAALQAKLASGPQLSGAPAAQPCNGEQVMSEEATCISASTPRFRVVPPADDGARAITHSKTEGLKSFSLATPVATPVVPAPPQAEDNRIDFVQSLAASCGNTRAVPILNLSKSQQHLNT